MSETADPAPHFISRRRFGEVEVAVVSAGMLTDWEPYFAPGQEWITPDTDVDARGVATGGLNWMLIRTPSAVVLVDPSTFEPGEVIGRATLMAGLDLESALAALGVSADQVTHVVISHLHPDHVCGLVARGTDAPRFSAAVHVVPQRDWQALVADDELGTADELLTQLGPVRDAGLLRLVDGDAEVSTGVSVLDAPGESPGHLCVLVETPVGDVIYLADLVHFPAEIAHIDWFAVRDRPAGQLVASRRRMFGEARPDTTFVYTHGRFPAWGRLQPSPPDGWTWRYLD